MADPRQARKLEEAAFDALDGTWDVIRAISWLTEALYPGNGLSEARVRQIYERKRREKESGQAELSV